jgi:hypothetical protein
MPTTRRSGQLRLAALGVTAMAVLVIWLVTRASGTPPRTLQLAMLNDSGVRGTVTFLEAGAGRTRVDVRVEPAGNLDMPAHIHPGSCDDLTPQPKFPLENVRDGTSTTEVPTTIAELFAGGLALNVHRSNDDLGTYTACVDIR